MCFFYVQYLPVYLRLFMCVRAFGSVHACIFGHVVRFACYSLLLIFHKGSMPLHTPLDYLYKCPHMLPYNRPSQNSTSEILEDSRSRGLPRSLPPARMSDSGRPLPLLAAAACFPVLPVGTFTSRATSWLGVHTVHEGPRFL